MNKDNESEELVEGIDYDFEDGLMVLTEKFLRERGYCCKNNCRHCPYGYMRDNELSCRVSDVL